MRDRGLIFNKDLSFKTVYKDNKIIFGIELGNTEAQNQALILTMYKGELKEHPLLGVGIEAIVNDDDLQAWKREIILNLEADEMKVKKVELNNVKLIIDACY